MAATETLPHNCPYLRQCNTFLRALNENPQLIFETEADEDMRELIVEGVDHISKCASENANCVFNLTSHNFPYSDEWPSEKNSLTQSALVLFWCSKMLAAIDLGEKVSIG